jgi:hypothetical protein
MSQTLNILAVENNVMVVQTPDHSHPGIVIQTDALLVLYGSVKTTLELLHDLTPKTVQLEEAILELNSVRDGLLERLAVLENVMENHNISLPYSWSAKSELIKLNPEGENR